MEALFDWGIEVILLLQSLGAWLTEPMRLLSFLGNEQFYLFVAPALVWCVSPSVGLRVGLLLMLSGVVNGAIKIGLTSPRPYWVDERVLPLSAEVSFGAPSGHAQHAVVVWGGMAQATRRGWVWALAITLSILIGLSRLYLGVHYPHDVLLGWLLGALVLWLALRLEQPILRLLNKAKVGDQILMVLGASLLMILIASLVRLTLASYVVPEAWVQMAARLPEAEPIEPLALSGIVSNAGVFFGLAAGAILMRAAGWFSVEGPLWQRVLRYLLGVMGVYLIWNGLGLIFPRGEELLPLLLRFIRYSLIGLWIMYFAPLLFKRLRIIN